jgi:uncharacterized protein
MTLQVAFDYKRIERFCQKWKIIELAIFGSAVRSDFKEGSDVDVLVKFAQDAHTSLYDLVEMEEELSSIIGREVDLVCREGIERSPNQIRREAILGSAEVVYAAWFCLPEWHALCRSRCKPVHSRFIAGKTYAEFEADEECQFAVIRAVEVISEAANRVSLEFQSNHADIPWRNVIGMRNRVIHGYDDITLSVIWETASIDLPDLIRLIETIV